MSFNESHLKRSRTSVLACLVNRTRIQLSGGSGRMAGGSQAEPTRSQLLQLTNSLLDYGSKFLYLLRGICSRSEGIPNLLW